MNVLRSGRTAGPGLASRLHQQQGLLLRRLRVRLSLNLLNLLLHWLLLLLLLDGDVGRRWLLQRLRAGTVGSITGGKDLLRLLLLLTNDGLLLNGKLRLLWKLLLLRLEGGPSDGDDVCGRSSGNDLLQLLLLLLLLGCNDLGLLNNLLYDLRGLIAWKHARIGGCHRSRRRCYVTYAG